MPILQVNLEDRSYPIEVGSGVLSSSNLFSRIKGKTVVVVTNDRVAPLYLANLVARLEPFAQVQQVILPDGEQHKTLATLNSIFDHLLETRQGRDTTLVALGGGVIGDMVGFAAATYQRGVDFIQVPTTLLAQVDSSVGGKTAVNHPLGKNMIGAFYQPKAVLIDTQVLNTLPNRELSAGMAEVIKYGCIYDAAFFDWLDSHMDALMARDEALLTQAIVRSCEIKAAVVAEDERENARRAILNFGHTYGHAIEVAEGYGRWLHGEAVGAGMVMAAELSKDLGWLSDDNYLRIRTLIARAGLPLAPPAHMGADTFLRYMALDKKVAAGKLTLVLLKGIGHSVVTADFEWGVLQAQLTRLQVS